MKLLKLLPLLCLLPSCTTVASKTYDLRTGREATVDQLARALYDKDVVFLGEAHNHPEAQRLQLEAIQKIHQLRPRMVISVEVVERDQQEDLDRYLRREMSEAEFVKALKAGGQSVGFFKTYKPILEYASAYQIPVIAANVPRGLAARVAMEGLSAVANEQFMPRETSSQKGAYFDLFRDAMKKNSHGGEKKAEELDRYFAAQCVKDDAMAESIVDYLKAERRRNRDPLVVHLCGAFHCAHGHGTVTRVRRRLPGVQIGIVTTKEQKRIRKPETEVGLADFLWVVREQKGKKPKYPSPQGKTSKSTSKPTTKPASQPGSRAASQPTTQPDDETENARPALNFTPGYDVGGEPGLLISEIAEGGAADKAGLEEGDLIVELGGEKIEDIQDYSHALGEYSPGDKVKVKVKRDGKVKEFEVTLGAR